MKVLIILAVVALASAGPVTRDKRSFGAPLYQTLQSNSEHSSSYQSNSQQSTSLQTVLPYQQLQYPQYQYQQYQPAYSVQPYVETQQVYNPVYTSYPVRQEVYTPVQTYEYTPVQTYTPLRSYTPVQGYGQAYTPGRTYSAAPLNWQGRNYGNNWKANPWC